MDVQQALAMGHGVNRHGNFDLETGTPTKALEEAPAAMGFEVGNRDLDSGLHAIRIGPEGLTGGSDPRLEGIALGGRRESPENVPGRRETAPDPTDSTWTRRNARNTNRFLRYVAQLPRRALPACARVNAARPHRLLRCSNPPPRAGRDPAHGIYANLT